MTAQMINKAKTVRDQIYKYEQSPVLMDTARTFTRSDGTIVARLYERLTKASRRRVDPSDPWNQFEEEAFRQGVYMAYRTLQKEIDKVV